MLPQPPTSGCPGLVASSPVWKRGDALPDQPSNPGGKLLAEDTVFQSLKEVLAVPRIHHLIDRAKGYFTRMASGMVPACRDNRPSSSAANHRKTAPDCLTGAYLPGSIYGWTRMALS